MRASLAEAPIRWRWTAAGLGIVGVGLAVRLWGLQVQSITMDEVTEIAISGQGIGAIVSQRDGFPPLYHLLLREWIDLFGTDAARGFSVVCGVLTVLVVWRVGRMLGGEPLGLISALLAAVSPILIWYSQEARANALFYLLAVLALFLFLRAETTARSRDWISYGACAVAGLYTHYYFVLVLLALIASTLVEPDRMRRVRRLLPVHAAIALPALPLLWLVKADLQLQVDYAALAVPLDLKSLGYTLVTFLAGFSVGPSVSELHTNRSTSAIVDALPWALFVGTITLYLGLLSLSQLHGKRWPWRLLVIIVVPIVTCGILASVLGVGYRVRYVAWCAIPFLVFLAGALERVRTHRLAAIAGAALLALSGIAIVNRNTVARYQNEDVRSTAAYLSALRPDSGPVFVTSGYMREPLEYYLIRPMKVRSLPRVASPADSDNALAMVRAALSPGGPFWLVYSRPWDDDPQGVIRDQLREHAELTLRAEYPGVGLYQGRGW